MRQNHNIAADLYMLGVRIVPIVGNVRQEYVFAGCPDCGSIATFDNDFEIKMIQSSRLLASLIEEYLLVMEYPIPRSRLY